jgi:hypothetical protein
MYVGGQSRSVMIVAGLEFTSTTCSPFPSASGLSAGVIELRSLADDDRARADDEYPMKISATGHGRGRGTPNEQRAGARTARAPRGRAPR